MPRTKPHRLFQHFEDPHGLVIIQISSHEIEPDEKMVYVRGKVIKNNVRHALGDELLMIVTFAEYRAGWYRTVDGVRDDRQPEGREASISQ
jgi:hypothetical protein